MGFYEGRKSSRRKAGADFAPTNSHRTAELTDKIKDFNKVENAICGTKIGAEEIRRRHLKVR